MKKRVISVVVCQFYVMVVMAFGVIHQHQFEGPTFPAQRRKHLFGERRHVVSLVIHRDDDRNFWRH